MFNFYNCTNNKYHILTLLIFCIEKIYYPNKKNTIEKKNHLLIRKITCKEMIDKEIIDKIIDKKNCCIIILRYILFESFKKLFLT